MQSARLSFGKAPRPNRGAPPSWPSTRQVPDHMQPEGDLGCTVILPAHGGGCTVLAVTSTCSLPLRCHMIATPITDWFIQAFAFAPNPPMLINQLHLLLRCLVLAHGLADLLPASRPLIYLTGAPGSGKTTFARLFGRLISGDDWDPVAVPPQERDFAPVLASVDPVVLDNLERPPAWLADALARATSGAVFRARKLYSDTEIVALKARGFIWVTTFSGGLVRGDLLDRAIPVRFKRPDVRVTESQMLAFVTRERERFRAEMQNVSAAVRQLLAAGFNPLNQDTGRNADFARVGQAIAYMTGGNEAIAQFNTALACLVGERVALAASDPFMAGLIEWARGTRNLVENGLAGCEVTAQELVSWLAQNVGGSENFDHTTRSAASLGKFLKELTCTSQGILDIQSRVLRGRRVYRIRLAIDPALLPPL